jgi:hypothetical protein
VLSAAVNFSFTPPSSIVSPEATGTPAAVRFIFNEIPEENGQNRRYVVSAFSIFLPFTMTPDLESILYTHQLPFSSRIRAA